MPDPLLCDYPLPLQRRLYPLGFPLDVYSNSGFVIAAAEQSWAAFPQQFDRAPAIVRVGVSDSPDPHVPDEPIFRSSQHLLSIVANAENFASCDLRAGYAFCWVTPALVREIGLFRYCFLEAIGYSLLSAANLAPVHAACVEWRGHGFLLSGDSGAGKSSLAYACAHSGFAYVSDDGANLLRGGDTRTVIGNPFLIRLRESAAELFPELRGLPVTFRPNGKATIELRTRDLFAVKSTTRVQFILFLRRIEGAIPCLVPFARDEALRRWATTNCYGHDEMRQEIERALADLAGANLFEFRYSDLTSAVAFLKGLVQQ